MHSHKQSFLQLFCTMIYSIQNDNDILGGKTKFKAKIIIQMYKDEFMCHRSWLLPW